MSLQIPNCPKCGREKSYPMCPTCLLDNNVDPPEWAARAAENIEAVLGQRVLSNTGIQFGFFAGISTNDLSRIILRHWKTSQLSRQRRWQLKKSKAGLCEKCGKPADSGELCCECREKGRILTRNRRRLAVGIPLDQEVKKTRDRIHP